MTEPVDAIVLAGAGSRRLGGVDKAMIRIGGRPMLGGGRFGGFGHGITVI